MKNFQDAIAKFQNMNVDATEFACLRAIILLKTCIEAGGDDHKEVRDQAAISALQDQAQLTLSKYISRSGLSEILKMLFSTDGWNVMWMDGWVGA